MELLKNELKIPEKYLIQKENRISATVHKNWLAGFFNLNPINFILHEKLNSDEIAAQPSLEDLGPKWTKLYIKVGFFNFF